LFPMLFTLSYASFGKIWKGSVDQGVEKDINLDIFEMTTNISEPTMKLINKKVLLIFKCYQVDVKDIKCPLQRWEKHESMSPTFCLRVR
jgi:hypothetical protein